MRGNPMNDMSALYEQDYYLWLQETYQQLEAKDINQIDLNFCHNCF